MRRDSRHLLQLTDNTPLHPRGLRAPLVFLALALAAQGSAEPSASIWIASLAALWLAALAGKSAFHVSALALPVGVFAAWIVLSNELFNPSYATAAPFHAAFLVGGFLLARRKEDASLYRMALLGACILSVWALLQLARGERAHAVFDTPATLAATLNLVLVPGLVLWAWSRRSSLLTPTLVLLVAALAATQSRGGWLALGAGVLAAMVLARRAGLPIRRPLLLGAAALVAVGFALSLHSGVSSRARLDLFGTALQSLHAPLAGSGYLSFYYHLEPVRASVTGYSESTTYFVHNDYLQVLLELGIPGLLALLALVLLPLILAWRRLPALKEDESIRVIGAAAAVAATAIHALVDYPFYVPACLLLFGAAVGVLDAHLPGAKERIHRVPRAIVTALCLWVLVTPVVAEAAADYAQRQWRRSHTESAAYWFEFARRVTPRDWRYHWYAGQFWQAVARGGNARAADLAEAAFAAGRAANSREVRVR
jgi:O-antigen ligase